jgi:phosphoglycolate phosphatase-like HAD superfamily hydrolase
MSGLVVGFDLDMTLIDTRVGFLATLDALGDELGVAFPPDMVDRLGPPLDQMLEPHLHADHIPDAVARFRELYPVAAVPPTPAFPGAHEALSAVRRLGGQILLVTGKFTPNAHRHVEHLGFDIDVVYGEVWGLGKSEALRDHAASIYVGDHVHDVEGALAAGATSVSVLTGGCTREELMACRHPRRTRRSDRAFPDLAGARNSVRAHQANLGSRQPWPHVVRLAHDCPDPRQAIFNRRSGRSRRCPPERSSGTTRRRASASSPAKMATTSSCAHRPCPPA